MLSVLSEPSHTIVAVAAFTGLRAGEIRGLTWDAYDPGDENSLGVVRVLHSVWRGRIGEPETQRSKAPVPLIPQLQSMLERHREAMGNPVAGPIFANGDGKPFDLDSLYRHQMKERLEQAGVEWEGWHGFRRGLATNLERIGVRESIAAMILRHTDERVTRKHYIKPPSIKARAAMRLLSEAFSNVGSVKLLPKTAPQASQKATETIITTPVQ
jgi:integrase